MPGTAENASEWWRGLQWANRMSRPLSMSSEWANPSVPKKKSDAASRSGTISTMWPSPASPVTNPSTMSRPGVNGVAASAWPWINS